MLALLLLSHCLALAAAPHTCSQTSLVNADPGNKNRCVRQATLGAAAALHVFSNGSCLLHDVCSRQEATNQAAAHGLPMYRRLRPGSAVLLLRTRTPANPHHLLTNGTANATQPRDEELLGRSEPYMSPLVTMQPTPFSSLTVQFFGNSSAPVVNLTFRVESGEAIREGDWFAKDRLESSQPWEKAQISGNSCQFRLEADGDKKFSIACSTVGPGGSNGDPIMQTLMHVIVNTIGTDLPPHLVSHYKFAETFPTSTTVLIRKDASEFRILGRLQDSHRVYVRVQ